MRPLFKRPWYHKRFAVKNNCNDCYMVLYNSSPLSLIHQKREIDRMGFVGYRLCFTNETEKQVKEVLAMYQKLWMEGKKSGGYPLSFGLYKRAF